MFEIGKLPATTAPITLRVHPQKVMKVLLSLSVLLVLLHGLTELTGSLSIFRFGSLTSIPTWYVSVLFSLGAGLALLITIAQSQSGSVRQPAWIGFGLAALLLMLSVNEVAEIHHVVYAEPVSKMMAQRSLKLSILAGIGSLTCWIGFQYRSQLNRLPAQTLVFLKLAALLALVRVVNTEVIAQTLALSTRAQAIFSTLNGGLISISLSSLIYALLLWCEHRWHPQPRLQITVQQDCQNQLIRLTEEGMSISFSARLIGKWLLAFIAVLTAVSLAFTLLYHRDPSVFEFWFILFNVGYDGNLPTWYSSFSLLLASGLLAWIHQIKIHTGDRHAPSWIFLSLIFLGLSIDEVAKLHERAGDMLKLLPIEYGGYLHFQWVLLGIPFTALVFFREYRLLKSLPAQTTGLFLLAGGCFVSGALGLEMLAGRYEFIHGAETLGYDLVTTGEELLEKIGVLIFVYALAAYIQQHLKPFRTLTLLMHRNASCDV